MHPRIYREFERICWVHKAGGRVLEIGAVHQLNAARLFVQTRAATSLLAIPHKRLGGKGEEVFPGGPVKNTVSRSSLLGLP